jgi:hypothetical protein
VFVVTPGPWPITQQGEKAMNQDRITHSGEDDNVRPKATGGQWASRHPVLAPARTVSPLSAGLQ